MPLNFPMWSGSLRKNSKVAAPPPDPMPYEVPGPEEGSPYIPANYDYSDGIMSGDNSLHSYISPSRQEARWRDRGYVATGSYPSAEEPAEDWHGYKTESWQRSERDEHLYNGAEGLPLYGQSRFHPALNPYWYRIPDERIQRAPHEFDFERPFDQGVLGERQLNGMHYSKANIGLTDNPSDSLKGMSPAFRRISTFRLEPTEWGENTVSRAASAGPPGAVFTSPSYSFYPPSFRFD